MTFEDLNLSKPLLKALSDLEYIYPTPIQRQAFSVILSGKDVVGIAQTGTGKTFAYLLPLIKQLSFSDQREPRILILAPTRELVLQIENEVKKLTKYTQLRSLAVFGGTNINTQKQKVYDGVDILVATPGRLLDLTLSKVLRLKSIQKVVLDEAEEMLSLGFRSQLVNILDTLPAKRQNLMFSATLTKDIESLIANSFTYSQKIEISAHGTPIEKIIQQAYYVPNFITKANLLELLLKSDPELIKVLVFVSTKKLADRLQETIVTKFPDKIGVIHSNKSQNNRINSIKKFQDGTNRVLIATDIIARGLDITDVTHVINFDVPEIPGDYIHRIGRTGRADKNGIAISFINEKEKEYISEIEQLMKKSIPVINLPESLVISAIYSEEERPTKLYDKNYLKTTSITKSKGAFHEKKEKNLKVNIRRGTVIKRKSQPKKNKPGRMITD